MEHKYSKLPKDGPLPVSGSWVLIHGGEAHLKRLLLERLRTQLLPPDDVFNFDQLTVGERWEGVSETAEAAKRDRLPTRADRILSLAQALPFLGSGRLVLVKAVDQLPNEQQKRLAAGIPTVPPMNHVILVTGDGEDGKANKLAVDLTRGIAQHGTVYDCAPLTESEAAEWVREALAQYQQSIDPTALNVLLTRAGKELRRLQIEVEKLSLLAGGRSRITVQDVALLTPQLAEESVFHLTDAVGARDGARALSVLRDLMERQLESPYRIFPMLVRQFRLLWQTKVMLEAGWRAKSDPHAYPAGMALLPDANVASQLAGWMGTKLAAQARQFSWDQLHDAYQALLECDMAGKAIEGVPRQELELALELLCAKLCVPPARTAVRR